MLDFPASPSNGQSFTSAGTVWTYDGTKWLGGMQGAGLAPINAPVFTGDARAVTPAPGDADTSVATTAFVAAAVAPYANNIGRNLLHNPLFAVQQRGAGPWTTSGYTADRWAMQFASTSGTSSTNLITATASTAASIFNDEGARFWLQTNISNPGPTGAGDYNILRQFMEDVRRLAGKTVTISFWAWVGNPGNNKVCIELGQVFGTGGSPSTAVFGIGMQVVTLTQSAARYSVTFAVPSVAGKTFGTNPGSDYTEVNFWMSAGSTYNATRAGGIGFQTNFFNFWGMQLEIAQAGQTQPTPLEKPEYADDLRRCQRFYAAGGFSNGGMAGASITEVLVVPLPATMRAAPAITLGTPTTNVNCGAPTTGAFQGLASFTVNIITPAAGGFLYANTFTASADL